MFKLLAFIHRNKWNLFKMFSILSLVLIFIQPAYGFAMFALSIVLLAYSDDILEYYKNQL